VTETPIIAGGGAAKRTLGMGSEQTAWAMLHRYRSAMVRPAALAERLPA